MLIAVRNSDNIVLYSESDLVLTASGLTGSNWTDPTSTSSNTTLQTVASLPSPWAPGAYSYVGGTWALVYQNLIPVAEQYQAQYALGIVLTCTGNAALNGTFATPIPNGAAQNIAAQANITAIEASIGAGRGLPGGGTTFNYFDISGQPHAFDTTHWNEAATAFMNYSYALQGWYLGGCSGSPPSNQITIA